MLPAITKDTQLCISLAARPSNIGTRFHNYLYAELGLDFVYKAFTTGDLAAAVGGIRALGIRGCGVSMPFKEDVLAFVDEVHPSAAAIESVNTLVNDGGRLIAYNTDYLAVGSLLAEHEMPMSGPVAVHGSGGMAKAVVAALRGAGALDVTLVARNEDRGRALAERYQASWVSSWESLLRAGHPQLAVNATPIGMAGGPGAGALAVPEDVVRSCAAIIDVVAVPARTPLLDLAATRGIPAVAGTDIIARQAAEQFVLYTGVRPDPGVLERAAAYSRGE